VRTGGVEGTGGVVGSGGVVVGGGGAVGAGGFVGSGGVAGTGGRPASGGRVTTGGGGGGCMGGGVAGGSTSCLGPSPLGAGVGGGACEGVRCGDSSSLGYLTCGWLVMSARASVFEAVRHCFEQTSDFCSRQPDSVDACTSSVFARACAASGAVVNGVQVDCRTVAAGCPSVSERDCRLLTDILNEKHYQTAFECLAGPSPALTDCATTFRKCVGVPERKPPSRPDGGGACPWLAGNWRVAFDCTGPGSLGSGVFLAMVSQSDCKVTFVQTDDQTTEQWVATGPADNGGKLSLKGDFGFTDSSMCDIDLTTEPWSGVCGSATQMCTLQIEI